MQPSVREASACTLALRRAPLSRAEHLLAQVEERQHLLCPWLASHVGKAAWGQ